MLAEALRERDEMKIDEGRLIGRREGRREGRRAGRQEGRREGRQAGRQEGQREGRQAGRQEGQREVLCGLASRRFGAAAGTELAAVLAGVEDASELARIGALIIDCDSGADFLTRARLR